MTIQDYRITLVALYGPNEDSPNFFENIQSIVSDIPNSSIIMEGDWNVVQDFNLDTNNYKTRNNIKAYDKIIEMKNCLDLVDIWRAKNPNDKRYTWRVPNFKQSRLDYFLISTDFEPYVKKVNIDTSYRSDHSPVYLTLQFNNQTKGKGTWKFNNSLLHEYVKEIKKCINDTVNQYSLLGTEDLEMSVDPHIFWEMLKCMIKGKTISYANYIKKKNQKVESELEEKLQDLQKHFDKVPSDKNRHEIQEIEEKLVICREKKINGIMARAKARWEAEGEKCTNYFCNLEKRHYNEKIIPKLIDNNGDEIVDQLKIVNEQKVFYEKLYSSSNPVINREHEDINNPYINKLSED